MIIKDKTIWINFILVTILSFMLIFIGVKFILGNPLTSQNILAFLGFSLILGLVSTVLYFIKLKVAYVVFNIGILVGYFQMYRLFLQDMNGWGDLTGLISLFFWTIIGLGSGLLVQLGFYFYKKFAKPE